MKKRWLQMILIFSVVAFVLYHSLLKPSTDFPNPTTVQTVFLLMLAAVQAMSFGCGVTFAIYGKEVVNKMAKSNKVHAHILYASIIWLLVAWLPYSLLSMIVGVSNMTLFLIISYAFQILLMLSGLTVAYTFINPFLTSESAKR